MLFQDVYDLNESPRSTVVANEDDDGPDMY